MSARRHPSLEAIRAWIADADASPEIGEHVADCRSCRALVDALGAARRARSRGPWVDPPDDVVERALGVKSSRRLPRRDEKKTVHVDPADVRSGDGAAVADDAMIVAGSCAGGDVSVLVHPPLDDALWRFEARVWLAESDGDASATIGLVHDDHVLQSHAAADGAMVRFEEIAPEGWCLEVHMPNGEVVVLDDPFHAR